MIKKQEKVGLMGSISLIVANMVGTGVFTSLGFQLKGVTSAFPIMLLWFIGGVTAFCGAVSYRQLIRYFPDSGGETYFVSQLYGRKASYLTGIISLIFGFAAPIALSALAFANYMFSNSSPDKTMVASILVIGISMAHSVNIGTSTILQSVSSVFKILILVGFICCGLWIGNRSGIATLPHKQDLETIFSVPYMLSFIYVHYAYSGWNASIYIFREIRQEAVLYRSLFLSVTIVTLLYLLLNFVFLTSSGIQELQGVVQVGEVAAKNILGNKFGALFSYLIALLLVSGISAMVWAGSRVSMKMEELLKGSLLPQEVPRKHIVILACISLLFIWIASFELILAITSVILSLCSVAVVFGLFIQDKRLGNPSSLSRFVKICAISYCLVIGLSNTYLFYSALKSFL
ncbi:APC family permease [Sphingobacterium sp. BIGb0165]|uniref:APC family permease n=1 Tax=Sphingobacterium sp. BIGb0165 TaxID=2940615 RepID=UPI0021682C3E|nr:amino acid permease [Sphingobacterium sp. BIGb0165]MCS4226479.1 APA family basic amino acid/polyamine antiporter [Sphingobacterium sp. BIGb0165]